MINKSMLLGRVGKINTMTTSSGVKITKLSLVTSKKIVKNGQKEEKSTWHNVTAFSKLAEIAESYVAVGDLVYIEGEMDSQKYTAKDGQEKIQHSVIANEIKLMPKQKPHAPTPQKTPFSPDSSFDNDLPF